MGNDINRRDFIQATLASGLLLAGCQREKHAATFMKGQTMMDGFITHRTAKLHYQLFGDHQRWPTLVLLHGGLGSIQDFAAVLPALAKSFHLVAIDSRGHGRSTLGKIPLSYAQLADDVQAILQHLHIQRYSVLGFSDSGIVAYRLAASQAPIDKIITVGAHWHVDNIAAIRPMYREMDAASALKYMPELCREYQAVNPEADLERLTTQLRTMWLDDSANGYPNDLIKKIQCSILAIRGEHDFLLSAKDLLALPEHTPDTHCMNVPFAEHEAIKEQPNLVLPAMLFFLQQYQR